MGRLIDEDVVIDVLKQTGIIQDNDLGHLVVDEINRIPTAYDVEKVVEVLVDTFDEAICNLIDGDECLDLKLSCSECKRNKMMEIVRKGGVNE